MSYHVLHVFQHGATLAKERGFIVCRAQDKSERKLPHEDLRAVIIAARGVTLTSNFVSAVLETDGIILHCNESYQPCGVTAPLERVIDQRAFLNQTSRPKRLNERIWQRILRGKTVNQQRVLEHKELRSPHLELALKSGNIDEGNCAKRYWQLYFPAIGWTSTKRDRKENTAPNQMLNYGYTVLAALCHRSLIVHGLTTALGVQHATRYRSTPLVFDIMEPFRPVVDIAAHLVREGRVQRFGFITTNSLRQTFNRRVLEPHLAAKKPLSLIFAIPDHPWVDSADGAAVRIAMTTARAGQLEGDLKHVAKEMPHPDGEIEVVLVAQHGIIHADLTVGADIAATVPLQANEGLSGRGVQLIGAGFIVTPEEAKELGLGRIAGLEKHIRLYRNGRDLTGTPRDVLAIDLFGLTSEEIRQRFPEVFQWVLNRVKPERDQNNRPSYRENWWVFGEPRGNFRPALVGLRRYIATVETAKHRFFVFLDASILPDNKLIALAFDDAYFLGVLSSHVHVAWALASGSTLEDRPVYVKTTCFEKFPFPSASEAQQTRIRELAESLDAHRKRQQAQHPKLTLTDIYNVLEKLRAGTPLDAGEQVTHEQGLVSILRQLHDDLDATVASAYGLPVTATNEEILTHLCALNSQRAAEERAGHTRWLRPSFQHPATTTQATLDTGDAETVPAPAKTKATAKLAWPKTLAEQAQAVRAALSTIAVPADAITLARTFKSAKTDRIEDILETLASLGQARALRDGRYVALL